jgi:hypothetical protein
LEGRPARPPGAWPHIEKGESENVEFSGTHEQQKEKENMYENSVYEKRP